MKGDFTRDTFDALNRFSRVLQQQGRVTIDADANEQTAILLHYIRTLARDLIGPYAAPVENQGFKLALKDGAITIALGRMYVDGILVENDAGTTYAAQRDYPLLAEDPWVVEAQKKSGQALFFYLDVWERHVTPIEDDAIREKALGGPHTCTRAKVVWQVKALALDKYDDTLDCATPLDRLHHPTPPSLAAHIDPGFVPEDACVLPPSSKYRGAENHLYRVEIHQGGEAKPATFKWSRDNGSVVTAWLGTHGQDLAVAHSRGFTANCWVELSDDVTELQERPGVLARLAKVESGILTVDPSTVASKGALAWSDKLRNPKIRRWDQAANERVNLVEGAVPVKESAPGAPPGEPVWIDLEDGIQVMFTNGGEYRSGQYWLIPARVVPETGGLEWPSVNGDAQPRPPHGIVHHYAPLGFVHWNGKTFDVGQCACTFKPGSSCYKGP